MRIQFLISCLLLIPLLRILSFDPVSGQCLDDQRSLLLQLKNSLVFNRNTSKKLVNWNRTTDCCKWDGIACDNSGHVITLNLEREQISGGIENTSSLFSLRCLENLNLAFNSFDSIRIPKRLQNLTNLVYLNLSNAGFGGQIPIELTTMTNLVVLDLSTLFPGVEPLKLENPNLKTLVQNLTRLRELYLDAVNISAQQNDWCQALSYSLLNLMNLSLRGCGLLGPLDPSLSGLRSLSTIHLDNNNLSTTVPDFFSNFSSLKVLTLSSCSLDGYFPETIFQVPTLQILDLSYNEFLSGIILQNFPQTSSLTTMVLSNTNFSGPLPDSIVNLRMLSEIDLSHCMFSGNIPPVMAILTGLVYLDFSFNIFTGSIPIFHMSKNLRHIELSRNSLSGSLSHEHFEGLENLEFINLGYNSLTGSIPSSLFGLRSLQRLQLSNNKFSGQVNVFQTLNSSKMDTLDLSNNKLQGPIPESFFELQRLSVLWLSFNFFNGTVKLEKLQRIANLTRLELGNNNLTVDVGSGNISSFPQLSRLNLASCNLSEIPNLRNQSRLIYLDLSKNHISGEIPSWIWNVGNRALSLLNLSSNLLVGFQRPFNVSLPLSVLDLHSNRLQGEFPLPPPSAIYVDYSSNKFKNAIPPDIGILHTIFFSLANNNLNGKIPESLCNLTNLQVLDLSDNNLDGSIPSCLASTLGVLNLGRNNLSGVIPDNFLGDCSLKTLDLSGNNLGGNIPPSLAKCELLEVMNVGNNKIEDEFPCMLRNSSTLRVLVLRSNRFYGNLTCPAIVNGSWSNLQIIDIAHNNFSGELYPKCITSWWGMVLGNDQQQEHIRYDFLSMNRFIYQDTVTVTIKGQELELVKILKVFTAIDFSCNNFTGAIPESLGLLNALYVLNLSHNSLTGNIPRSVGNLSQLGSLDLSVNELTGELPNELADLNFLSFLNISYNRLSGRIPKGSQLQTFTNGSFAGNPDLCGPPLSTRCDSNVHAENSKPVLKKGGIDWRSIITGLGFGVGASIVVAPLAFCSKWREKFDDRLDRFMKLVFPRCGTSYVRCDNKVDAITENIEDESTDDDEDGEASGERSSIGKYCLFCTKFDFEIKRAVHNPQCACDCSLPPPPPPPKSSPSSSSSLLVIYQENY